MGTPNFGLGGALVGPGHGLQLDVVYFDDFFAAYQTGDNVGKFSRTADQGEWLMTDDVDGTAVIKDDDPGGVLRLTTGSNANDFVSCQHNGEAWKVADGKDIYFEIRMKLGDSDDTRWFVGLATTDVTGTTIGPILDGATESIGFRQNTDTGVDIYALTEDNSTETETDTGINVADNTYVTLGFHVQGNSRIRYYVDGAEKAVHTTNIPDGDAVTLTMELHSPTASSTLDVDYIYCTQVR